MSKEKIAELEKFHRSLRDKRQADRVKAVIALSRGWSGAQVAEILLFDEKTSRHYFERYQQGGLKALLDDHYSGAAESPICCIALDFPTRNRRMFPANKTPPNNRHFSKNMNTSKQTRVKTIRYISPMPPIRSTTAFHLTAGLRRGRKKNLKPTVGVSV